MTISWYSFTSVVAAITCVILSIFTFSHNKKSSVNKYYSIILCCMAIWCLDSFLVSSFNLERYAWIHNLLYIGAILSQVVFVKWVHIIKNDKSQLAKLLEFSLIILAMFFCVLSFAGRLTYFSKTPHFFIQFVWPDKLYKVFVAYSIFCALYGSISLKLAARIAPLTERKKINYIFYAALVMYVAGTSYFLFMYNLPVLPIADIFVVLSNLVITYAIIKHQLMEIEVIIRRTAVFAGLFTFIYSIFTIVTLIGQEVFKDVLGWNQWVATVPTVLIITFFLRPIEKILTNATEKYLFQKKYDYRNLLKTFTDEVLTVIDLQILLQQTVSGLIRILKLESAAVLLINKDEHVYNIAASAGIKDKSLVLRADSKLALHLKSSQGHVLKDKLEKAEPGAVKDVFKALNAQLCLPISLHENLIGILTLGMKKSGEDYTQEDIDILSTLARTEAIAISNAQLVDELSKTQAEAAQSEKMAVIGTLAAGINHEICNPLGIVRGHSEMFLLNARDGFYDKKTADELLKICTDILNKVIKETDRATAITKKLSGFAKPSKRSDLEEVVVEREIDEVLGLLGHDLKLSNVEIHKDFPNDFPVFVADKKQIQEVLFNIIRNAAQAMDKKRGKIALSGFRENGYAVLRIADNGSGIPSDKINQIFNPFFTTKSPGKGTGLGLFIVKQVVEKNRGTITVESSEGAGTSFTLKFPTAANLAASHT